ncbi:hypothetical protein B0H14DRAFT_3879885 [Mycena olivaceomarginata]|nr:hypothetical protein B0H14DRAFT_3879885 [Mycena olivaceomarginata]
MQSTSFTTSPNTRFIADMDGRPPPLVRARKRVRNFVKGTFGRLKPGANDDATYQDLLWTSLTALKTSADAFPPLKGVVGAVISIMEISQRIAHSKKDARELAGQAVGILILLSNEFSTRGTISPPMLGSIERFETTLEEIQSEMNRLMNRSRMWRLKHLNRTEETLRKFNKRLDDTSREFTMGLAVRTEVAVYRVHAEVLDTSAAHLNLHNKEMRLLRGILLLNAVFFLAIPRFGGLGGLA